MKKLIFAVIVSTLCMSFIGAGNVGKQLPSVKMKTLEGTEFEIPTASKPVIISFWSTTCIPCIKELNAINSKYDAWKKETKFEVYAVSTDDARFASRVPLIAKKKGWKFSVLTDQEKKAFTALGVSQNPYTIVVDKTGKIVYEHASYTVGDEDELIKIVKGLK